jgi:hypothetical protein
VELDFCWQNDGGIFTAEYLGRRDGDGPDKRAVTAEVSDRLLDLYVKRGEAGAVAPKETEAVSEKRRA